MNLQRARAQTGNPVRALIHGPGFGVVAYLAAHVALAMLMRQERPVGLLHAGAVLAAGLLWARSGHRPERVAYIGAYITGAEVLWRMTATPIVWEFAKYATAAIFFVAMLRERRLTVPALPLLYFALFIPSTVGVVASLGLDAAREPISFNLSGPLTLMVSTWFFSRCRLSQEQFRRLLLVPIGPIIGIASLALYSTLTSSSIVFSDASNRVTSGGYGPNQVSAMLGLGAFLAFLLALDSGAARRLRTLMFGGTIGLATASALTFSRGGLLMAAAAAALAGFYLIRDGRSRLTFLFAVALIFAAANYALVPYLEDFTGGAFLVRFQDTRSTGRDLIVESDLEIWLQDPLFGAGPGQAKYRRTSSLGIDSHTEFTRAVAEHGILGLVGLLLLLTIGLRSLWRADTAMGKAIAASMVGWSAVFMLVNAMRLAAPAFIFGLASVTVLPGADPQPAPVRTSVPAPLPRISRPRPHLAGSRPLEQPPD